MNKNEITVEMGKSKKVLLLELTDDKRFRDFASRLEDSYALGTDEYPKSTAEMFEFMMRKRKKNTAVRTTNTGSSFTQNSGRAIDPNWILLDTCSTDHVFCNKKLLSNVHNSDNELKLLTNAGISKYNKVGFCNMFNIEVHYNPNSIANVISYDKLSKCPEVKIYTDSSISHNFIVKLNSGATQYVFKPCEDG